MDDLNQQERRRLPFDRYLMKPFRMDEIERCIRELLLNPSPLPLS